jgi:hypothetical protein
MPDLLNVLGNDSQRGSTPLISVVLLHQKDEWLLQHR